MLIKVDTQISDLEENFRREVMELKLKLEEKEEAEKRIKQVNYSSYSFLLEPIVH